MAIKILSEPIYNSNINKIINEVNDKFNKKKNNKSEIYNKITKIHYSTDLFVIFIINYIVNIKHLFSLKNIKIINPLNYDSIIEMIIKGNGEQKILNEDFIFLPNVIIIDNVEVNKTDFKYNLTNNQSDIIMKWNYSITNCSKMFYGLSNIIEINLTSFNTSNVTDFSYIFYNCSSLTSLDLRAIDSSNAINMSYMFYGTTDLKSIQFGNFKTLNVENMSHMFQQCVNMTSLNLSIFDTSLVTEMIGMFSGCNKLKSLYLDNFNTLNVISMKAMFQNCNQLSFLSLNNWDTSKVIDMSYMFNGCGTTKSFKITSLDLNHFNTSNVQNMSCMFYQSSRLNLIKINKFNTSNVIDLGYIFSGCSALSAINLSLFDTSNVRYMGHMFESCKKLQSLNLNNFDTSIVTSMVYMFKGCNSLESLFIENFNTSSVQDISQMFNGCKSLKSLNLSSFNTSKVTSMNDVFKNCQKLTYLDLSNFDTSKVKDMNNMFYDCMNLTSLDLSNFDTTNTTKMQYMFNNCKSLISLNVSNFNTQNVSDMSFMFNNCCSLYSLDINHFNTAKVSNFSYMFSGCNSLISLNLSNFKFDRVKDMKYMFYNCSSLLSLDISNFKVSSLITTDLLFYDCTSLIVYNFNDFNETDNKHYNILEGINLNLMFCLNLKSTDLLNYSPKMTNRCPEKTYNNSIDELQNYDTCFISCPKRTIKFSNNNISQCKYLNCENNNQLYNFNQTECINSLPEGYFQNNSIIKTIDKCHIDCKTCDKKGDLNNSNCKSCFDDKYFYLGNCISCKNGYYKDSNNNTICKCENIKCFECTFESLEEDLCTSCNTEKFYYPKSNDINYINNFIDCYIGPQEGYFLFNQTIFEKCYKTCKYCSYFGNEVIHNCTECNSDYIYMSESNCYNICDYYYYYLDNKTFCTSEYKCPEQYKIINEKNECVNNCSMDNTYKYEFNNSCYISCPNGTHISNDINYLCVEDLICIYYYNYNKTGCIDKIPVGYYLNDSIKKTINKCDIKCKECSFESVSINNLCISCNSDNNYYPLFIYNSSNNSYVDCYNNTLNEYKLDSSSYKLDELDEKTDEFEELNLETNLKFIQNNTYNANITNNSNNIINSNDTNLFPINCSYYHYNVSETNYFCTDNEECPEKFPKLIKDKNQCIDDCRKDLIYIYDYKNQCLNSCPNGTNIKKTNEYLCEEEISLIDNITYISYICSPNDFFKGKCNITNQINKDEMINYIKKEIMNGGMNELISTVIQNDKKDLLINEENTIFQITSSENQKNNKNDNISTILLGECETYLKNIYKINENLPLLIFKIDYYKPGSLVPIIGYEVYHPINKSKLDLNYCKNASISINIPVSINENELFKYDPEHEYYKDECFPSTTESGTDILINDRQNEFNENNMSLCEKHCNYTGYEMDSKTAKCDCEIRTKDLVISELMNQNDLSYNFTSKEQTFNMVTMKCYYTLFTKEGLAKNIVSYIILSIIGLFIFFGVLFYKFGYPLLENDIKEIKLSKEQEMNMHNINRKDTAGHKIIEKKAIKKRKSINKKNRNKKLKIKKNSGTKSNSSISFEELNYKNINNEKYNVKGSKISHLSHSKEHTDYELNTMCYKVALRYDKRTFFDFYFSLIRTKCSIIFSLAPIKDYNSKIIKISMFFLFFSVYYFINALFFDEPTIHQIYEDEGFYNFIYLVPHIFCSFAISHTLNTIIKHIFLSERDIHKIRKEKDFRKLYELIEKVEKCLIIKYISYFCLSLIFLLFFWYYLSSFGAVYKNTQIYLIKNTAISFSVSLFYPFIINIFPAIFRIYSLRGKNKNCSFKISKIIQYI